MYFYIVSFLRDRHASMAVFPYLTILVSFSWFFLHVRDAVTYCTISSHVLCAMRYAQTFRYFIFIGFVRGALRIHELSDGAFDSHLSSTFADICGILLMT